MMTYATLPDEQTNEEIILVEVTPNIERTNEQTNEIQEILIVLDAATNTERTSNGRKDTVEETPTATLLR